MRSVVAYRVWHAYPKALFSHGALRVDVDELGLWSVTAKTRWKKEMEAVCQPIQWVRDLLPQHKDECAPGVNCVCGLHGATRFEDTKRWVYANVPMGGPSVLGVVLLGGQMYSGGLIIRAQYAAPIGLLAGPKEGPALASMYDIPLYKTPEEMRYFATEEGDELTDEQCKELAA